MKIKNVNIIVISFLMPILRVNLDNITGFFFGNYIHKHFTLKICQFVLIMWFSILQAISYGYSCFI